MKKLVRSVPDPPVVAENNLIIRIEDKAGQPGSDVGVHEKYYVTAERQSTQKPYTEYNTEAMPPVSNTGQN